MSEGRAVSREEGFREKPGGRGDLPGLNLPGERVGAGRGLRASRPRPLVTGPFRNFRYKSRAVGRGRVNPPPATPPPPPLSGRGRPAHTAHTNPGRAQRAGGGSAEDGGSGMTTGTRGAGRPAAPGCTRSFSSTTPSGFSTSSTTGPSCATPTSQTRCRGRGPSAPVRGLRPHPCMTAPRYPRACPEPLGSLLADHVPGSGEPLGTTRGAPPAHAPGPAVPLARPGPPR